MSGVFAKITVFFVGVLCGNLIADIFGLQIWYGGGYSKT